jgi:hypothetical protein
MPNERHTGAEDAPATDEPGMAAADSEPTRRGQGEVTIE